MIEDSTWMTNYHDGRTMHHFLSKKIPTFVCLFLLVTGTFATNSNANLAQKINAIEKKSNAIIGITAIHIENNKAFYHNSNQRFFMASTIKVPIAIAFLKSVDEKKDSLNRQVRLDSHNSVPGSGTLYHLFEKKQLSLSTQQLLRHMLIYSDNSASDTILRAAKGPKAVTQRMAALGFKNISVNRSILEMLMTTNHVNNTSLKENHPVSYLKRLFSQIPLRQKALAWQHFQQDKRDTTTPDDMARLLVKLYKNQAISKENSQLLIKIMEQCKTGPSRIRGLLPYQVKVAHKTGTWAIDEASYIRYPGSKKLFRFVSDVGIITLPNNRGHIAIAVYVKSKAASNYMRSRAIALASRAVYDHFMTRQS